MDKQDVTIKLNLESGRGNVFYKGEHIISVNMSRIDGGVWLKCLQATIKYYQGDKDKCITQK